MTQDLQFQVGDHVSIGQYDGTQWVVTSAEPGGYLFRLLDSRGRQATPSLCLDADSAHARCKLITGFIR